MAISVVGICNSALLKLGSERISSLSDDNKRAIACNERWEVVRDEVLMDHPWNFALKRAELSEDATAPTWGFDSRYPLPADCLRVLKTEDDDYGRVPWKVEGRYILTDATEMKILYIAQITDPTYYTPKFAEVAALRLAADLAYHLAQSITLAQEILNVYRLMLADARMTDAQEGTPDDFNADYWIDERN
jgi:hypothetical protein